MPKLKNQLPKYRKHRGSGQAVMTIEGRDIYLGIHGSKASHAEYDRLMVEYLANGRRLPTGDEQSDLTIESMLARFVEYAQMHYGKTSEFNNYRQALRPLRTMYAETPASSFGPKKLKAVRQKMIAMGWCRTNINKQVSRLRSAFKWAAGEELIPASVPEALKQVDGLRRGKTTAKETDPVRPALKAHIDAVRPYASRQVWALIQLQLHCGARPGELVTLRPIDLKMSGDVWTCTLAEHKTAHRGHNRTIFLGPECQGILGEFMTGRAVHEYLFSPVEAEADRRKARHADRKTPLTSGNRPGSNRKRRPVRRPADHYTVDSYRRAIQRACEHAGVPKWRPHQLRHNAATLIRSKFGPEAARVFLGHRSLRMTELYAEIDEGLGLDVALKIG